uniref:Uncharacterized protein n=1 Tax=Nelumbo nucifera TaxID=4432 RepID=A0A822Z8D5_NELNU|nr:TPA_asm: hypothetical protein HUJ06_015183 [Nelumbo nucifera]
MFILQRKNNEAAHLLVSKDFGDPLLLENQPPL